MNDYALSKGLAPITFDHVNGWSLMQYRALWHDFSHLLETVRYDESHDLSCLNIIRQYPSCFKNRTTLFEDFTVSHISALFRKRCAGLDEVGRADERPSSST